MIQQQYAVQIEFAKDNNHAEILISQCGETIDFREISKNSSTKVDDPLFEGVFINTHKQVKLVFHTVKSVNCMIRALKGVKNHLKEQQHEDKET